MQPGIESIAAITASFAGAPVAIPQPTSAAAPGAFANLMMQEIADLNTNVVAAETSMQRLAAGEAVELHEVMINLERARIGVQTFIQIRNKLIESYQDVMRMQL